MCQEHGPGNKEVKIAVKLKSVKSVVKNEDMVAKCYCIALYSTSGTLGLLRVPRYIAFVL